MRPPTDRELTDLEVRVAHLIACILTQDPRIQHGTADVILHAMKDHGATTDEAGAFWSRVFAGALRRNAEYIEQNEVNKGLIRTKSEREIDSYMRTILDTAFDQEKDS